MSSSSFGRKRLYDSTRNIHTPCDKENSSNNSNVKVIVRVRPENKTETAGSFTTVVVPMNENILSFDPDENSSPDYTVFKPKRPRRDMCQRRHKDLKFGFDRVFGPEASTFSVYENTTKLILDGLLDGYNCSVFAYGATGAGKTYTMLGTPKEPGVMYLTMIDLYKRIAALKEEKTCEVAVSYLEVYNEQIRDLLMPSPRFLPIREDSQSGVVIPGLSLHKPTNADELLYMLQFGNENRSQHPTDANAESSRSHAVLQVFVRQKDRTANISTEVKVAKMCLVDLAGSERATVTKNSGKRFREGANINRSLLALGNVINALADNKSKGHIPYRDSKLTRLLKDSLGGNCRTVMIAAVSPSFMSFEDTYNTLKYADRAKNIKATLKKNILSVDFHVSRYGQIVEDLRREIVELKEKLEKSESGYRPSSCKTVSVPDILTSYRERLNVIYSDRMRLSTEQMEYESLDRELQFKKHRKGKLLSRILLLGEMEQKSRAEKIRKSMKTASSQLVGLQTKKEDVANRYKANDEKMQNFHTELSNSEGDNIVHEMLDIHIKAHDLMVEIQDARQQIKHLKKLVKVQEKESQSNDRLLASVLSLVKKQFYILKGQGLATSDIVNHYQTACKMVEGCEVSWADDVCHKTSENQFLIKNMMNLPVLSSQAQDVQTPKSSIKHRLTPVSDRRFNQIPINADTTEAPDSNSRVPKRPVDVASTLKCTSDSYSSPVKLSETEYSPTKISYADIVKSPAGSGKKICRTTKKDREARNDSSSQTCVSDSKVRQNEEDLESNKNDTFTIPTASSVFSTTAPVVCNLPLDCDATYTVNTIDTAPKKAHQLNSTFAVESKAQETKSGNSELDVKQNVCVKDTPVSKQGCKSTNINPNNVTHIVDKTSITPHSNYIQDSITSSSSSSLSFLSQTITKCAPTLSLDLPCVPNSEKKNHKFGPTQSISNFHSPLVSLSSTYTKPHTSASATKSQNLLDVSCIGLKASISDYVSPLKNVVIPSSLRKSAVKESIRNVLGPTLIHQDHAESRAAKRSIHFEDNVIPGTPNNACNRSYADIVKTASPAGRTPLKLINQDTASPLAAPLVSPDKKGDLMHRFLRKPSKSCQQKKFSNCNIFLPGHRKKTVNFEIHKEQSHRKLKSPVVREPKKEVPRYQQMTASSSIKNKINYARVQVNKENVQPAQRTLVKKETNGPSFNRKLTKSKSTSSLSRFGWQNR